MRPIRFRAWDSEHEEMYEWGQYKSELVAEDFEGEILKLMQYTGLKDKNGVEIYEGDIVRHATDEGVYKVIFEDGGFYVKNLFEYDFQPINEYPLEVIGNIYENPELLERESGVRKTDRRP